MLYAKDCGGCGLGASSELMKTSREPWAAPVEVVLLVVVLWVAPVHLRVWEFDWLDTRAAAVPLLLGPGPPPVVPLKPLDRPRPVDWVLAAPVAVYEAANLLLGPAVSL